MSSSLEKAKALLQRVEIIQPDNSEAEQELHRIRLGIYEVITAIQGESGPFAEEDQPRQGWQAEFQDPLQATNVERLETELTTLERRIRQPDHTLTCNQLSALEGQSFVTACRQNFSTGYQSFVQIPFGMLFVVASGFLYFENGMLIQPTDAEFPREGLKVWSSEEDCIPYAWSNDRECNDEIVFQRQLDRSPGEIYSFKGQDFQLTRPLEVTSVDRVLGNVHGHGTITIPPGAIFTMEGWNSLMFENGVIVHFHTNRTPFYAQKLEW